MGFGGIIIYTVYMLTIVNKFLVFITTFQTKHFDNKKGNGHNNRYVDSINNVRNTLLTYS